MSVQRAILLEGQVMEVIREDKRLWRRAIVPRNHLVARIAPGGIEGLVGVGEWPLL
jgi:hypothetical protein